MRDDRIKMKAPVRLQRRGRLLVALPQGKLPMLSPETVKQTRAKLLEDRALGLAIPQSILVRAGRVIGVARTAALPRLR